MVASRHCAADRESRRANARMSRADHRRHLAFYYRPIGKRREHFARTNKPRETRDE